MQIYNIFFRYASQITIFFAKKDREQINNVSQGFSPKTYHFYDDKNAKMANDRQKELTHGTHEILAGIEYGIDYKF